MLVMSRESVCAHCEEAKTCFRHAAAGCSHAWAASGDLAAVLARMNQIVDGIQVSAGRL